MEYEEKRIDPRPGWVAAYRSLINHWIWQIKPFSIGQSWIDLILKASFTTQKKPYKGVLKVYERGTVNCSISQLAEDWGVSRKTARRWLDLMEQDHMITVNATNRYTTITIENYGLYQNIGTTELSTHAHQSTQLSTQPMHIQVPTIEQGNNVNHVNNDNNVCVPDGTNTHVPSLQECIEYGRENGQDGNKFYDYYTARGWKANGCTIVDWRAQMRSWKSDGNAKKKITGGENGIYDC